MTPFGGGPFLAQGGGRGAGYSFLVRKTANETVNNTTTLQNDDHLLFAMEANGVYFVEGYLLVTSTATTDDFKCGWTVPASATARWGVFSSGAALGGFQGHAAATTPNAILTESDALTLGTGALTMGASVCGLFVCAGTAGNAQFQWAQGAAVAANLSLLANSHIRVLRLA